MDKITVTTSTDYMVLGSGEPIYDVVVDLGDLKGPEGNAFMIVGATRRAIKEQVGEDEADAYATDAMGNDYIHLLMVTGRTVRALVTDMPETTMIELETREKALSLGV